MDKLLPRLDKNCVPFTSYAKSEKKSIYHRDWDATRNPYDLNKVDRGHKYVSKSITKNINLGKGTKRDFEKIVKGSVGEAY